VLPADRPPRPLRRHQVGRARAAHRAQRPLPAAAVHRHPRGEQERRAAALAVREGALRRHHVRRVEHRGLRAHRGERHAARPRPHDVPDLPVGGPREPHRAAHLRHQHARRRAVPGRPARRAQAPARPRARDGLLDDERGDGGRVLHVQEGPERRGHHRDARRGRLLRPGAGGPGGGGAPRDRRRARADGVRGGGGAPRGGARPARDRLPLRRRAAHGRQHRDVPLRREVRGRAVRARRVVHAQADLRAERERDAHPPVALPRRRRAGRERVLRRQGGVAAERDRARLHRRAAAPRPRDVRDHQPARELVQAARAGLRGAGERRLEHAQPHADDPHPRAARAGHAHRVPRPRPVGQPVSGARRPARGRARRRRDQGRPPRAGEPEHLGDELPREAPPAHRRPAARPQRGVRRAREERRDPRGAGAAHHLALPRRQARGVARVHHPGHALGAGPLPGQVL
ncbi:MAG: Glutamine synthetase type I, partial [uncultured Gemmatimonadaceae bacterium]